MKGQRMGKRSSLGNIMRRRLSDITNTRSQFKVVGLIEEHPRIPESTQDLLNQLLLVRISFSFLLLGHLLWMHMLIWGYVLEIVREQFVRLIRNIVLECPLSSRKRRKWNGLISFSGAAILLVEWTLHWFGFCVFFFF